MSVSDGVGEAVRSMREANGWRRVDLAERCAESGYPGLTEHVIGHIETGRRDDGRRTRDITVDELVAFAVAFGVDVVDLLGGSVVDTAKRAASLAAASALRAEADRIEREAVL